MDKKRIFIAIPASSEFQKAAMKYSLEHAALPVRWLPNQNLHLTLIPPMEIPVAAVAQLANQLRTIQDHQPFEIHFDKVTFGPQLNQPRLIWATGKAPNELYKLKEGIEQAIDYQPDRKLLMHITLARFEANQFHKQWHQQLQSKVHMTMLVERFVIMESVKTDGVAKYPILQQFKLK